MTARIRIEKADETPYIVMVQVQCVTATGKWANEGNPKPLHLAAQQLEEFIHQNKRVIVYETPLGNA